MSGRSIARRAWLASVVVLLAAGGWMTDATAQNRAFSFAYDQPPTTAYGNAASV